MDMHHNARLTPIRRAEMAQFVLKGEMSKTKAALRYGVCVKTVSKWVSRFEQEGEEGIYDRSSRPHHHPRATAKPLERAIIELRRERLCGQHIAKHLNRSPATVSRVRSFRASKTLNP